MEALRYRLLFFIWLLFLIIVFFLTIILFLFICLLIILFFIEIFFFILFLLFSCFFDWRFCVNLIIVLLSLIIIILLVFFFWWYVFLFNCYCVRITSFFVFIMLLLTTNLSSWAFRSILILIYFEYLFLSLFSLYILPYWCLLLFNFLELLLEIIYITISIRLFALSFFLLSLLWWFFISWIGDYICISTIDRILLHHSLESLK